MKSFNQFLQESYLNEEPAGRPMKKRKPGGPTYEQEMQKINAREAEAAARKAQRGPTGAAADSTTQFRRQGTTTNVSGPDVRGGTEKAGALALRPEPGALAKTPKSSGALEKTSKSGIRGENGTGGEMVKAQEPGKLARSTGRNPSIPDAMLRGAQDAANKPPATPKPPASTPTKPSSSVGKPPALSSTNARRAAAEAKKAAAKAGSGPGGKAIVTPAPSSGPGGGPGGGGPGGGGPGGGGPGGGGPGGGGPKPPTGPKLKVPAGAKKALRIGGKLLGPAAAALDVADERSKGSGWLRSLAKGAVVAAGGAAGGAAGTAAGPVGTFAGATGGAMAASKAFDVVAGKNARERAADRMANRQRQAGTAVKGIGGKTTFSQTKPGGAGFMSTGSGSQRKTVQLAKTGVVQRGGQSVAGHLAFKTDSKGQKQAVYKAPPAPGTGTKNPLERIGRSLFKGAYKQSDAANAARNLAAARQNDANRQKALGVKFGPGK